MIKNIRKTVATTEKNLESIMPNWKSILTKHKIEYWKLFIKLATPGCTSFLDVVPAYRNGPFLL